MTIKRIIATVACLAVLTIASVQSYAFMISSATLPIANSSIDVQRLIGDLQYQISADQLTQEHKLALLDDALEKIDAALDAGASNESELMVARDAIIDMKNKFTEQKEELVQFGASNAATAASIASRAPQLTSAAAGAGGAGTVTGGTAGIASSGVSGGLLGSAGSMLAPAAAIGGIGLTATTAADRDEPGIPASN